MYRISRFIRAALLALPLAAAALPAHAAGSWCAAGKPVRFAGVTWESGNFTSEVLRYVLKNGYGCQTDTVPGSTAATETALSRNDIQVWSEQWTGRSEIVGNAVQAGSVKLIGDTLPGGTKEGWYVPDYVIHGDPARGIKPSAPSLVSMRGALGCRELAPQALRGRGNGHCAADIGGGRCADVTDEVFCGGVIDGDMFAIGRDKTTVDKVAV